MYVPSHFEETRTEVLHRLVRDHPLAALITYTGDGLEANHVPLELEPGLGPLGTLRGHVARANPMWRTAAVEALAIFQGRIITFRRAGTRPSERLARWSRPGTMPWSTPTGRCA